MNFDNTRKNYAGLAFVAALHLAAAGIALKNATVWITHAAPAEPVQVKPLPPETRKVEPAEDFKVPLSPFQVVTPPRLIEDDFTYPEAPTITTSPPDAPPGSEPGPGKGEPASTKGEAPPRHEPKVVAAVIDSTNCAKPAYPAAALRNGDEGTVTLAFLIGKDGRVASAKVEKTSGFRDLDRAALQGLSMCAFKPGTVDGAAQESWARMQYSWRLDG